MGYCCFRRSCDTNYTCNAPAPNPDPKRWTIQSYYVANNAYVLVVKYLDATNFEGVKVMVYKGKFPGLQLLRLMRLDPHFSKEEPSPIARFRPDAEGLKMATKLASSL